MDVAIAYVPVEEDDSDDERDSTVTTSRLTVVETCRNG